jgi:1-deoxy-D-xylulose-5-phosphate reductoisomerase
MKNICILGSTGSIGTQALDIVRGKREAYRVVALAVNRSYMELYNQALEFSPKYVVLYDSTNADELQKLLKGREIKVLTGMEGLEFVASLPEVDILLTSVVGMIGLKPTIAGIRAGKIIALANKETLVAGGQVIYKELANSKASIIPVDSEHCALFQCLKGKSSQSEVRKLILTASGGPFRGKKPEDLRNITPNEALKHPRWNMGPKISIDSATLINKAFEVIEAHWLFNMDYDRIDVIIHPQSIIHSMVEYVDGSIIAQMSNTDMRHPIQYALDYPVRNSSSIGYLDLTGISALTFENPDRETFKALELGYRAGRAGGTLPAVMNAANEVAVMKFLDGKISFLEITQAVKQTMDAHENINEVTLERILDADKWAREYVTSIVK